jgi:two-component system sensor histidine kinase TctE
MHSLKSRLAAWVFLPVLFISTVDLISTFHSTDRVATLVQAQLLKGAARIIAEHVAATDGATDAGAPPAAFELFANEEQDKVFYAVRSAAGQLIDGDAALTPPAAPVPQDQEIYFLSSVRGEPVHVIAYSDGLPNGGYITVEVAQTLAGHTALRKNLFLMSAREHLMLVSMVLLALVIAFRWTLRPLMRFSDLLSGRQAGSLEPLREQAVPKELLPVIDALNGYVVRLDRTLKSYERFVASTAHHLRTYFAILTSQLNYGMRDASVPAEQKKLLAAMQTTTVEGTKVINQLLMLATVEQGRQHPPATGQSPTVVLGELVTSVIEELAPLAHRSAVELGLDYIEDALEVTAPPHLLREIAFNLIDNAIKHMDGPGSVSIVVRCDGQHALLRIVDTGPGIAAQHMEHVFERFYRADPGKPNSSGLGLAIVKEICDTLGADIALRTPEHGAGLEVDVRVPLSRC